MFCDGNSGGEGGFDLNAFVDWGHVQCFGCFRFCSSPGTQGSLTPAYQTPYFPIDTYYRPSAPRYGQKQGLSQIMENIPEKHTPENLPTEARRGGDRGGRATRGGGRGCGSSASHGSRNKEEEDEPAEDLGRNPYSSAETMALFDTWINTLYDPIVGNQQTRKCFWDKVTDIYNKREAKNYQSGASGADILRAALRVFKFYTKKDFKHVDV